jgi:hypothetical protein
VGDLHAIIVAAASNARTLSPLATLYVPPTSIVGDLGGSGRTDCSRRVSVWTFSLAIPIGSDNPPHGFHELLGSGQGFTHLV